MLRNVNEEIEKALAAFPRLFDERLKTGWQRILANSSSNFVSQRSHFQLKLLLLIQYSMQRKIEKSLSLAGEEQKTFFLRLFQSSSQICCALMFRITCFFSREQLVNIFHTILPGIHEVPFSYFMWVHPDFSYKFCYIEFEKLRGKDLSKKELRVIEQSLREQLIALPPLTPALFWPYNEEESIRHIQLMLREMHHPKELPHISILFQEQSLSSLEFLVHYVRPKNTSQIELTLTQLPRSFDIFWRFSRVMNLPFEIEMGAFSLKVPSAVFDVRGSINLLYARRYIAKNLEVIFGPFRDYNGGLFEKQQYQFEYIRMNLSEKIPLFDLFAEKVFYALHPVEARLALSLKDAENLLLAFSEIMQSKENQAVVLREGCAAVIKNGNSADFLSSLHQEEKNKKAHAQINLGGDRYFCLLSQEIALHIPLLLKKHQPSTKTRTLRLSFQEGAPLSLSPHFSSGDMRCRLLSKLLFEGLMRLNAEGKAEPAGAKEIFISEDGLLYRFKLRPSFWSNGENVTAIDYVTSWQKALREHVSHPEQLFVIKNGRRFKEYKCDGKKLGLRALDAKTLEIELEWQDPQFLYKLAQPNFFPLFGSMREPKWFNGPYLIRKQSREGLFLERNPYFWENKSSFFEQIEIKWLSDLEETYKSFLEGNLDWIGDPLSALSPQLLEELAQANRLKERRVNRRFVLYFNTRLPLLSSPQIRHALSMAIDRKAICSALFPHSTPLIHASPYQEDPEILLARGLQELHLTKSTCPPLTFTYSHQTSRQQLALSLQSVWQKKLGIPICLEKIEWNLFRNKLERGSFEITTTIQETLEEEPLEFLDRFEGANSWNFSRWKDSRFRALLDEAKERKNRDALSLVKQAENILIEQAPFTPLVKCTHVFAHHPQLENYFFDLEGCVDFSRAHFK